MLYFFYNLLFPILFLLYFPFYLVHILRRGGLSSDYFERFALFSKAKKERIRNFSSPVWIHAISVGETVAAISFIKNWQASFPSDSIVFSCGTATAFATAQRQMPPDVCIIYSPIDCYFAVRRSLALIKPKMLLIFEVEIWPNLILQSHKQGVKVALINGRMSDNSSKGYARWKKIFQPIFRSFDLICLQTVEDAERVKRIIGEDERIKVCGTMKFDQIADLDTADKLAVLEQCFGPPPWLIFTAGSTHSGEEELVADAYAQLKKEYPLLKMILVPRHQERATAVEAVLKEKQLSWQLLKKNTEKDTTEPAADVLLVNTTGELMNFYALSDICFVGKSLAGQSGGHNIIEPAIFGKAILFGAKMDNFREVAEIFKKHNAAIELANDEELLKCLRILLADEQKRLELGKKARKVVEEYRGSIAKTIGELGNS